MAKNNNLGDFLIDLANGIRAKKGYTAEQKIDPQDFRNEIESIATSGITEFLDFNHFPEVGESNLIYIDNETNMMYRYDTEKGKYVVLGFNPDDIVIINANGGNS